MTVLVAHAWNGKVGVLDKTLAHEAAVGSKSPGRLRNVERVVYTRPRHETEAAGRHPWRGV